MNAGRNLPFVLVVLVGLSVEHHLHNAQLFSDPLDFRHDGTREEVARMGEEFHQSARLGVYSDNQVTVSVAVAVDGPSPSTAVDAADRGSQPWEPSVESRA